MTVIPKRKGKPTGSTSPVQTTENSLAGGAATGLGYLSSVAAQRFQMAAMFVPIIIIAGLGAGLTELLKSLERRLDKWKPQK